MYLCIVQQYYNCLTLNFFILISDKMNIILKSVMLFYKNLPLNNCNILIISFVKPISPENSSFIRPSTLFKFFLKRFFEKKN